MPAFAIGQTVIERDEMSKEREMIDLLLMEFGDRHYHGCPADFVPEGECNCYAGALCNQARDLLSASIADTAGAKPEPLAPDGFWEWFKTESRWNYRGALYDNAFLSAKDGWNAAIRYAAPPAPSVADAAGASDLKRNETYIQQMAGISTAALGYWKEGDSIHPDYDTVALRDVAKLYAKYDALYNAAGASEGMEKDALRYRWLRGHLGRRVLVDLFGSPSGPGYTMDGIDAEIDLEL